MLHKSEGKKVWALQKHLSEGGLKGDHLMKKSGWSDQYLKKCFIKVKKKKLEPCKALFRRMYKWQPLVENIRLIRSISFMDDLVVDVTEKMWILVSYRCKKCFIKVNKKKLELCKRPYMLGRNRENSIHLSSPIWDPTTQHNGFLAPHAEAQFGCRIMIHTSICLFFWKKIQRTMKENIHNRQDR